MDNYTVNDAFQIIRDFMDAGNPYPDENNQKQVVWERHLVAYAMNKAHENGYKQREEGL